MLFIGFFEIPKQRRHLMKLKGLWNLLRRLSTRLKQKWRHNITRSPPLLLNLHSTNGLSRTGHHTPLPYEPWMAPKHNITKHIRCIIVKSKFLKGIRMTSRRFWILRLFINCTLVHLSPCVETFNCFNNTDTTCWYWKMEETWLLHHLTSLLASWINWINGSRVAVKNRHFSRWRSTPWCRLGWKLKRGYISSWQQRE